LAKEFFDANSKGLLSCEIISSKLSGIKGNYKSNHR